MDLKRTSLAILVAAAFSASVRAQDHNTEAAKSEALALKAQIVELEELKAQIKAQGDKIDKLTQEISKLTDSMKPKGVSPKNAEPAPTPTPAGAAANPATSNPATAGVDNPSPSDANVRTHVVAKGETLTQISKQYGVTVEEIEQLNKIEDAKKLQAGQTIKIPAPQPSPGG
jgi:LysM repeat protein